MTQDEILSIFKEALWIVLELSGPMLLISIVLGLVISILQAATQIHEQTLTFVPKLVGIALILLIMGPWMMSTIQDFTINLFEMMTNIT